MHSGAVQVPAAAPLPGFPTSAEHPASQFSPTAFTGKWWWGGCWGPHFSNIHCHLSWWWGGGAEAPISLIFTVTFTCVQSLSRVWLCDPMDCSQAGSSVHRIFQAGILRWVAISYSRASFRPSDSTCVSLHFLRWKADSLPLHHLSPFGDLFSPT